MLKIMVVSRKPMESGEVVTARLTGEVIYDASSHDAVAIVSADILWEAG